MFSGLEVATKVLMIEDQDLLMMKIFRYFFLQKMSLF